ncbi:MAG: imelysin family protein [Leptospiraceae bacterium]|nr:imelysin family protein [Leptospiraceae bacterium]
MKKIYLYTIILLSMFLCKSENDSSSKRSFLDGILANLLSSFQAKPVLKNISENVILKSYTELESKTKSLKDTLSNFPDSCGGDTSRLVSLRESWKSANLVLKKIELVQLGPSGSYSNLDPWPSNYLNNPPNAATINSIISGTDTINESFLSSKTDSENGFPVIEYLLFDNGLGISDVNSVCAALLGRRKTYLLEAVNLFNLRIARLSFNWNPNNNGNFSTILQNPNSNNEFYKTDKDALDALIKQIVTMIDKVKEDKLGYPSGLSAESGGSIRTTNVENRFSNTSIESIRANLEGLETFYLGGINSYVAYFNISLDKRTQLKIKETIAKTKEISNLRTTLESGNLTKVRELNSLLNELKIIFTVEIAGNLGSTFRPGLGDGDGD